MEKLDQFSTNVLPSCSKWTLKSREACSKSTKKVKVNFPADDELCTVFKRSASFDHADTEANKKTKSEWKGCCNCGIDISGIVKELQLSCGHQCCSDCLERNQTPCDICINNFASEYD
jgi:hypothetical protein